MVDFGLKNLLTGSPEGGEMVFTGKEDWGGLPFRGKWEIPDETRDSAQRSPAAHRLSRHRPYQSCRLDDFPRRPEETDERRTRIDC